MHNDLVLLILKSCQKFYVMRKQRVTDYRGRLGDFLVRCGEHNVRQHVEWTNPQVGTP